MTDISDDSAHWQINNAHLHAAWLPAAIDLEAIYQEVQAHGFYTDAANASFVAQDLMTIRNKYHIHLAVVYFPDNNHVQRTLFRDIADYLSHNHLGTVLVFNTFSVGTESNVYSRAVLESSESHLRLYHPNTVIQDFARGITSPQPDWNLIVPVVFSITIIGVFISRVLSVLPSLRKSRMAKREENRQ